ncbi:hypothetical protein HWC26_gp055 [Aeromonas phage 2L372X]|uniref:Uncharacterized protein n=2 Tax=Plateaulakevirus TaxID=2843436 RepID=A0A5B9N2C2_9CAUD|nr:hypothetical protein HWC26_gp055 [Aeromonas phage 2L372X]YP_009846856.1 hypothetical protein HWC28_gp057 [Aeromonas phage 4L372XY]QEG08307.1 hypothetical protein [Aeromonas phage 2L372X]QEG08772.1 hypothetical protein [Aeromonas phage 4L372XY]
MSYYNEMYIPIFEDSLEDLVDLLYFYEDEDGFDNMLKLLKLTSENINVNYNGKQYVIFKPVSGAVDTLRPRDLDWGWHDRETYFGDCDCFIFVADLHNRVDLTKIANQYEYSRIEKLVSIYQSKLKDYGENLIIFPI